MTTYYIGSVSCSGDELFHHGVKGMKWGKHLFGLWDQYVTGNTANRMRQHYQNNMHYNLGGIQNAMATGNNRMLSLNQQSMQRNAELYNRYNNSYNNSLAGRINRLGGYVRNGIYYPEGVSKAMSRAYSRASQLASNAYSNAAKALGDTGRNIGQFYADVIAKAKNAIQKGAGLVAQFGGAAVENIKAMGKRALEGAKNFIEKLLGRNKKSSSEEDEEENTKRDITPKLSGKTYNGVLNGTDETTTDKAKKTSTKTSASKSGLKARAEERLKEEERKKKKLRKVYRGLGKMDLSVDSSSGLPDSLKNLGNLRR